MKIKHKEKINERKLRFLSFISFLLGFAQALLMYVESSYFKLSLGNDNVGMFYFTAYVVALIGLLNMHRIIKKIGKNTAFFLFFFLQIFTIALLIMVPPSMLGIILLMLYIIAAYLVLVVLDIIIESYSVDKKSGRIRGFHLTVTNVGFLLGPLLSTSILEKFDYFGLFFIAMLINMGIFVVGLLMLRDGNKKFDGDLTVRDLVKKIFVNKDLMKIYWISFALEFFYALMVVYTPLYLLEKGLDWGQIGIIFTFMLVPFVIFEYPAGILADKKFGEKEMIIGALLLIAFSTMSIYFIRGNAIWLWGSVLFITRVGASFVETLRDSYFYKRIDGNDMDVISFFRTSRSVAYIASTALSAIFLFFFSLKIVFLLVTLVVLLALYPAFTLVDNDPEMELEKAKI
jgi:MFS family permease